MVDFIGIGAQKSGTSWVYACLYEHPEICAPVKELHFFSRPRYEEGIAVYAHNFRSCGTNKKVGEYSTSYLYSDEAAERIATHYPEVRLIAVLRNPMERAYSQYRNAIKAGEITTDTSYQAYLDAVPSCIAQGQYAKQLEHYYKYFTEEQILVLIYEDIAKDPQTFMSKIYTHLGVASDFSPPSLHSQINVARAPKQVWIDRLMHRTAETLRQIGLDRLVHRIKRSGVTDTIRAVNTKETKLTSPAVDTSRYFSEDMAKLSNLLGRDFAKEWVC